MSYRCTKCGGVLAANEMSGKKCHRCILEASVLRKSQQPQKPLCRVCRTTLRSSRTIFQGICSNCEKTAMPKRKTLRVFNRKTCAYCASTLRSPRTRDNGVCSNCEKRK